MCAASRLHVLHAAGSGGSRVLIICGYFRPSLFVTIVFFTPIRCMLALRDLHLNTHRPRPSVNAEDTADSRCSARRPVAVRVVGKEHARVLHERGDVRRLATRCRTHVDDALVFARLHVPRRIADHAGVGARACSASPTMAVESRWAKARHGEGCCLQRDDRQEGRRRLQHVVPRHVLGRRADGHL